MIVTLLMLLGGYGLTVLVRFSDKVQGVSGQQYRENTTNVVSVNQIVGQVNDRKISNIRRTKSRNLYVSRLGVQLSLWNKLKPSVKWKNEDVVGTAPTGDAPTTCEWLTILLPNKVPLILQTWQYIITVVKPASPD